MWSVTEPPATLLVLKTPHCPVRRFVSTLSRQREPEKRERVREKEGESERE